MVIIVLSLLSGEERPNLESNLYPDSANLILIRIRNSAVQSVQFPIFPGCAEPGGGVPVLCCQRHQPEPALLRGSLEHRHEHLCHQVGVGSRHSCNASGYTDSNTNSVNPNYIKQNDIDPKDTYLMATLSRTTLTRTTYTRRQH